MPEEIRWIIFIAMVTAAIVNIIEAVGYHKKRKECIEDIKEYHHLIYEVKNKFWKHLGAYEAPENGQLFLDLAGGLRLVIFEGKIEGWYFP